MEYNVLSVKEHFKEEMFDSVDPSHARFVLYYFSYMKNIKLSVLVS